MTTVEIHGPANTVPRINAIWAVVSIVNGCEGLCGMQINGTWWPLLAADETRLAWLREQAAIIARHSTARIQLIRLETRVDLEEFPRPETAA